MQHYITSINQIWQIRDNILNDESLKKETNYLICQILRKLEKGEISVARQKNDNWHVNEWLKKAILLYFQVSENKIYDGTCLKWYDKVGLQFTKESHLSNNNRRIIPGAYIREGAHIGQNTVIMPSFINIGAHIGDNSLIDSWATIGSCAYIGKNCHISGGVGIGGVLEPLQANPVIIEDNCFIGARSEIAEGVIIGRGSVISMGVFLGASTKIIYRDTGQIIYGQVPPYSVIVPGTMPAPQAGLPSLACAVIIKQVDAQTRSKTSINEILR